MDSDEDDSNEESNDVNCENGKGQTQEKRKRGRPPKKKDTENDSCDDDDSENAKGQTQEKRKRGRPPKKKIK